MLTVKRKKQLMGRISALNKPDLTATFDQILILMNANAPDCLPFLFSLASCFEGEKDLPPGYILFRLKSILDRKSYDPQNRDKSRAHDLRRLMHLVTCLQRDVLKVPDVEKIETHAHRRARNRLRIR